MTWPARDDERSEDDYDSLMGAWFAERGRVVEAELLLTRARELLGLSARRAKQHSPATRREIRRLIGEIDDQLR